MYIFFCGFPTSLLFYYPGRWPVVSYASGQLKCKLETIRNSVWNAARELAASLGSCSHQKAVVNAQTKRQRWRWRWSQLSWQRFYYWFLFSLVKGLFAICFKSLHTHSRCTCNTSSSKNLSWWILLLHGGWASTPADSHFLAENQS